MMRSVDCPSTGRRQHCRCKRSLEGDLFIQTSLTVNFLSYSSMQASWSRSCFRSPFLAMPPNNRPTIICHFKMGKPISSPSHTANLVSKCRKVYLLIMAVSPWLYARCLRTVKSSFLLEPHLIQNSYILLYTVLDVQVFVAMRARRVWHLKLPCMER